VDNSEIVNVAAKQFSRSMLMYIDYNIYQSFWWF